MSHIGIAIIPARRDAGERSFMRSMKGSLRKYLYFQFSAVAEHPLNA